MKNTLLLEKIMEKTRELMQKAGGHYESVEMCFAAILESACEIGFLENASEEEQSLHSYLESVCKENIELTRDKAKEKLKQIRDTDSLEKIDKCMNIARKYAVESYLDEVTAGCLLGAILHQPIDFVKEFVKEESDLVLTKQEMDKLLELIDKRY